MFILIIYDILDVERNDLKSKNWASNTENGFQVENSHSIQEQANKQTFESCAKSGG